MYCEVLITFFFCIHCVFSIMNEPTFRSRNFRESKIFAKFLHFGSIDFRESTKKCFFHKYKLSRIEIFSSFQKKLENRRWWTRTWLKLSNLCYFTFDWKINKISTNSLISSFLLELTSSLVWEKYKLNLSIPKHNQFTFGTENLRAFEPKVWNTYFTI